MDVGGGATHGAVAETQRAQRKLICIDKNSVPSVSLWLNLFLVIIQTD